MLLAYYLNECWFSRSGERKTLKSTFESHISPSRIRGHADASEMRSKEKEGLRYATFITLSPGTLFTSMLEVMYYISMSAGTNFLGKEIIL